MARIMFSKEWDKLKDLKERKLIHTVRWGDKLDYYKGMVGKEVRIVLKSEKFVEERGWKMKYYKNLARAKVTVVKRATMGELTDEFIQNDTFKGCSRHKFFDLMANYYLKKKDWNGWQSLITVIYMVITEVFEEN